MQAKTKLDKALENLVCSKKCTPEEAPFYREKLVGLAKKAIDEKLVDRLSKMYKGLADETRLRIVSLLKVQEMCVCELMAALGLTQPTASHHLMILENAEIIKHRKEGKFVFYRVSEDEFIRRLLQLAP